MDEGVFDKQIDGFLIILELEGGCMFSDRVCHFSNTRYCNSFEFIHE